MSGLAIFPGGATGLGLLLLRVSVATSLLALCILHLESINLLQFLVVLAAMGLCAGFRTRVVAGLSLAVPIFGFATGTSFVSLATLHSVDALALVLTGPGAWSTDALFFGRRTVTLPNRSDGIG